MVQVQDFRYSETLRQVVCNSIFSIFGRENSLKEISCRKNNCKKYTRIGIGQRDSFVILLKSLFSVFMVHFAGAIC